MMMMITAGLDTGAGLCNIHSTSQQLTGIKGILTDFDDDDLVPFFTHGEGWSIAEF